MDPSRVQRWLLSNQYRILELLDPENSEEYSTAKEAIDRGYEAYYDQLIPHILEDTVSESDSKEVFDIMFMFDNLEFAYDRLGEKPLIEDWQVRFDGFDANTEGTYYSYARFLLDKAGWFQRFKGRGDGLNSHRPTLDTYRRMLEVWNQLGSERQNGLTSDDIKLIADAAIHPENR